MNLNENKYQPISLLKRNDHRRSFSNNYKLDILKRVEEIKESRQGSVKAFLSNEGIYASHLTAWKKQISQGKLGLGKRGRPIKNSDEFRLEITNLRQRLIIMEKRALEAEQIVRVQMAYVKGAALRLKRRDRGLISEIVSQVKSNCSVSALCDALALTRQDFYRTIKPLLNKNLHH